MIGVLIHVEREDRPAARERMAVVGCPLIDEIAIACRPGEEHPTGAAAERFAHRDEFRTPAFVRAERPRQLLFEGVPRLALLAEPIEEETHGGSSSSSR